MNKTKTTSNNSDKVRDKLLNNYNLLSEKTKLYILNRFMKVD